MKKTHIIALVLIAVAIATLISFMGDVTTYETIASAKQKPGRLRFLGAAGCASLVRQPRREVSCRQVEAVRRLQGWCRPVSHPTVRHGTESGLNWFRPTG